MNFNNFIGLVTSPQIVIDAVDMGTVFGELENWNESELAFWLNDIICFHFDMSK